MRGVNVNPLHAPAAPHPSTIRAQGFDSVRFILRNSDVSRQYHQECQANGLSVLGLVTNQTLETYDVPSDVALRLSLASINEFEGAIRNSVKQAMADHPDLVGLECGNEPDDPGE